jgi:hypothetical protein
MEFQTVVNRTTKDLNVTWDGKRTRLAPGKNSLPLIVAEAAKRQNPLMGSLNPFTGLCDYLVGIEEQGDDCSPIEQSTAIEVMDRSKMKNTRPTEVVPGDNGIYSVRDIAQSLPLDSTFVKP